MPVLCANEHGQNARTMPWQGVADSSRVGNTVKTHHLAFAMSSTVAA